MEARPRLLDEVRNHLRTWTQDLSKATRLASAIKAGTVWVNCHLMFDASLPIGGYKESGWSRDSGMQAIDNYLETKTVCMVVWRVGAGSAGSHADGAAACGPQRG